MRILGIDPGLRTTGFGVIDVDGQRLSYVASGTISTRHLDKGELPARLKVLFDGVCEVVARYQPQMTSVEIVFVNVNPQSTLLLGQARGACVTALVSNDLPVAEYTALQMKQAVVGYGRDGLADVVAAGDDNLPGPQHGDLVLQGLQALDPAVLGRVEFARGQVQEGDAVFGGPLIGAERGGDGHQEGWLPGVEVRHVGERAG